MKKRIIYLALMIFLSASFCIDAASQKGSPEIKNEGKFVVYYFHTTGRCITCLKMEKYTDEALKAYFPDELKSGKIEWKVIDVEKPENNHFIKKYNLYTKTVIISEVKDGKELKWKNLDEIWMKVRDKNAYMAYIKEDVTDFMKGAK
jgi:hypothetical protein